jgi:hypothetical protein
MRRLLSGLTLVLATFVAAVGSPAYWASAAADDQARLDAAIEEFNARMTEVGWTSQGPPEPDTGGGIDEDEPGDVAFAECLGEGALVFEDLDNDEFPGQVAMRESDEFVYAPDSDATATTDAFSLDLTEQTAGAVAVTVDDASVATITQFLGVFGSKETSDCIREGFEADMAADAEDSDVPLEFEIDVSNEADLGIGDHSAAISFNLSTVFMVPITVDADIVFAQVGNDLVGVYYFVTGEPVTDFDPRQELQAIVDALAA